LKKKNLLIVKLDHLKISRRIAREIFKNVPMKEKTVRNKNIYSRKSKHKPPVE